MSKNKISGIISWLLGLFLVNILSFCLERGLTPAFWITMVFVWIAFISVLVFQMAIWKHCDKPDTLFMKVPAIVVSMLYIMAQFPICIVFSLGAKGISARIAVLVNGFLMGIFWLAIIGTFLGHKHIQKVNSRQKNHHMEL